MSDFIIVFRNPYSKKLGAVGVASTTDSDYPRFFTSYKEAEDTIKDVPILKVATYEILEITI